MVFSQSRYTNSEIDEKLADLKNQLNKIGGTHGPVIDVYSTSIDGESYGVSVRWADGTIRWVRSHNPGDNR